MRAFQRQAVRDRLLKLTQSGRLRRQYLQDEAPRDIAHEAGVFALREPFGLGADGRQHVGQVIELRLGVVAQHVTGDALLDARVTDADPEPPEIRSFRSKPAPSKGPVSMFASN